MYELKQISDNDYYIVSPAKVGLVKLGDSEVCLIDSGNDKSMGRKIKQILDKNGWHLKAIYNTHSHADHIGGNAYLERQTGCSIFAPGRECDFTNHPSLESDFLYGGFALPELRHKFLRAKESSAQELRSEFLPPGFEILSLPGHSFDMVGYRTPDNTVYLADCLSSRETLDKYKIGFLYDVGSHLKTLEYIKTLDADVFVPAHAKVTNDITNLADYNIAAVHDTADKIVEICEQPVTFEEILKALFDAYDLELTHEQYALIGSTLRSYLTWLVEEGRVRSKIEDNRLLWESI